MILNMHKIAATILICFAFFNLPNYGQSSIADPLAYVNLVKKQYGLDHELVNGVQFYNRYSRSKGHPFFHNNLYLTGTLSLDGKTYQDLHLKFDIYSQHVVLEYKIFSGGSNQVITVADKVDAFNLGPYHFKKLVLGEEEGKFYQVITTSCFNCYIYWKKELLPLNGSFTYIEQFSEAKRSLWLDLGGELHEFSSRKDFTVLFPEESRKEIKRYLSKNQFKFRTATVDEILRNLEAVCKLLEEDGAP